MHSSSTGLKVKNIRLKPRKPKELGRMLLKCPCHLWGSSNRTLAKVREDDDSNNLYLTKELKTLTMFVHVSRKGFGQYK